MSFPFSFGFSLFFPLQFASFFLPFKIAITKLITLPNFNLRPFCYNESKRFTFFNFNNLADLSVSLALVRSKYAILYSNSLQFQNYPHYLSQKDEKAQIIKRRDWWNTTIRDSYGHTESTMPRHLSSSSPRVIDQKETDGPTPNPLKTLYRASISAKKHTHYNTLPPPPLSPSKTSFSL